MCSARRRSRVKIVRGRAPPPRGLRAEKRPIAANHCIASLGADYLTRAVHVVRRWGSEPCTLSAFA